MSVIFRWKVCGFEIDIDSKDGGKEILVDEIGVVELIICSPLISNRDVKIAVGPEMQISAVVITRFVILGN